jgi:hypothetical protein
METSLLLALWTTACAATMQGRHRLSVIIHGLMVVTRPEAAVLLPFALPGLLQLRRTRGTKALLGAAALALAPSLVWVGFCLNTTGHPLPNSFYLKATSFSLGSSQFKTALQAIPLHGLVPAWAFLAGVAGCIVSWRRLADRSANSWSLLLATAEAAVFLGAVVGSRSLFLQDYYWARWVDPACVMFTLLFCIGCSALATFAWGSIFGEAKGTHPPRSGIISAALAGITVAAALAASAPHFIRSFSDRRGHLASDSRAIRIMNVAAGEWIHENTPANAVIALNDAGAIRYFGQRYSIDLMGLNYAPVAFNRFNPVSLMAKVDWIAIFPTWFRNPPFGPLIKRDFQVRHRVSISLQEYTVMDVFEQTLIEISARKTSATP